MARPRKLIPIFLAILVSCERSAPPKQPPASVAAPRAAPTPAPPPPVRPACPDKPNILLVSLDTVRFDATALDPASRNDTPFLRGLRERGLNFTRCYSTFDATPQSHFSMLTGFVQGYKAPFDRPEVSLPHQLGQRGYRSFGVSANGNLSPKSMRSLMPFQSFVNLQDEWEQMPADRKAGQTKRLDARLAAFGYEPNDWNRLFQFSSANVVLRYLQPQLAKRQPFFGFVNFLDAHDPYAPDPAHYRTGGDEKVPDLRYRQLPSELADPESIADEKRRAEVKALIARADNRAWSVTLDLDKRALETYRRRYLAEVRELDGALARLFAELEERKLLDTTIVIITADHGESFGQKQLITHSFNNSGDREVTNRVPLLILLPPCYGIGPRQIDDLCTIADIPATLYDLLKIDVHSLWKEAAPGNYGRSLRPLFATNTNGATAGLDTTTSKPLSAVDRQKQDAEATRRLRSLGYIQ